MEQPGCPCLGVLPLVLPSGRRGSGLCRAADSILVMIKRKWDIPSPKTYVRFGRWSGPVRSAGAAAATGVPSKIDNCQLGR